MKFFPRVISLLVITTFFSCQKKVVQEHNSHKSQDSLVVTQRKQISNIGESLSPKAKKMVDTWKEYQLFDELLTRFYAISPTEALSNANELNILVTELNDSIRIKNLKTPPMIARLHVLRTECLRLKDMATIPAIKEDEVSRKVTDILSAFSAVNAKINSIYAVDALEEQLTLDSDFQMMIKDDSAESNTKVQTVPTISRRHTRNKPIPSKINKKIAKPTLRTEKKLSDKKKRILQQKLQKQKPFIKPPKK